MGGGAGARVIHGSIAAVAAVLATAAATVDIPDKLHLKATPVLFYAVPVSMPLPPLSSLSGAHGCLDSSPPFSVSFSRVLSPKECTTASLSSAASSQASAFSGSGRECGSCLPYASAPFSLAQEAPSVGPLSVSSRAISNLLSAHRTSSIMLHPSAAQSVLWPGATGVAHPSLAPFAFATSGLYAAPVTEKHVAGYFRSWKLGEKALKHPSFPCYSVAQPEAEMSVTLATLSSNNVQTHSSSYLESLLLTLSSFQESLLNPSSQPSQSLHTWDALDGGTLRPDKIYSDEVPVVEKPVLTVVLLGWLGAQQKHLKKYAQWYNARGIHAVTFVIPMTDILSLKVGENAEEHVDSLARHLAQWLSAQDEYANLEGEKQLMFHTFSNTGWLTYGAILEKMQAENVDILGRIKGCVIDSAPVPDPDPQVWASGFSAALLKKRSSATKPALLKGEMVEGVSEEAASQGSVANLELGGTDGLETAVLTVLERFFSVFLKLPSINQRLAEIVTVLQKKQPPCPQLYIYSTADKVIPVKAVEAFIEDQRKAGRVVRACNLQSSPHVDHFRSHPQLYSEQLSSFLKEVLPPTHAHAVAQ